MDSSSISLTLPLFLFIFALSLRALFSFLETSITALRLFKLKELANSYGRYKTLFESLEKKQSPGAEIQASIVSCKSIGMER